MPSRPMHRSPARPIDVVLHRMRAFGDLSAAEIEMLCSLTDRRGCYAAGDDILAEGEFAEHPHFILSGWACRQRVLPDGRRQIFALLLAGDSIGLSTDAAPATSSIRALTALETVEAGAVLNAARSGRAPGIARAIAAADMVERRLLLDHVVRLGCQTAYERTAHLLLELQDRLALAGLADHHQFPLPVTQEVLADALGLSIVHVNRTLQQLRRERLIELRSGLAILVDRDRLANIADYRPADVGDELGQAPAARRPEPLPVA